MVWTSEGGVKNSPLSCAALFGELGEKIFVYAPEHISGRGAQRLGIEHPQHAFEQVVLEPLVILRQLSGQRRERGLDRFHGGSQCRAELAVFGPLEQHIIARSLGQQERAPAREIRLYERPIRHPACRFFGIKRRLGLIEAVGSMAQKDEAQNRHEIFIRCEPRIGSQIVRNLPKVRFELRDAGEVISNHDRIILWKTVGNFALFAEHFCSSL